MLVAITDDGDRWMIKAPQRSVDLMEAGLKDIPEVVSIYKVACQMEDMVSAPKDYKPQYRRNLLWCCYCGEERRFVSKEEGDYLFCEICGISNRDFYIKKMNLLDTHKLTKQKKQDKERRTNKREKKLALKKLKEESK